MKRAKTISFYEILVIILVTKHLSVVAGSVVSKTLSQLLFSPYSTICAPIRSNLWLGLLQGLYEFDSHDFVLLIGCASYCHLWTFMPMLYDI